MAKPTWEESVERGRLAGLKTFEGRMEAAKASLEQIPPNGKDASGHTLSEFAEATEIGYDSVQVYRRVWLWIGADLGYVSKIGAYSVAVEACKSDRWKTVKGFLQERDRTPLPEGFKRWTVDAVRTALLNKPMTHTGRAQQQAASEGRDVTPDEQHAASAADHSEQATEEAGKVKDPEQSRKARAAADKSSRQTAAHHKDNVAAAGPKQQTYVPDDDTQALLSLKDLVLKLKAEFEFENIPGEIQVLVTKLVEKLDPDLTSRWLDQFGAEEFESEDDDGRTTSTMSDLLLDTHSDARRDINEALDRALAKPVPA